MIVSYYVTIDRQGDQWRAGDKRAERENLGPKPVRHSAEVCARSPPLLGFNAHSKPCRERWSRKPGGGSGIRTHDTVSRIHAFQACAFSHSAIPPQGHLTQKPILDSIQD